MSGCGPCVEFSQKLGSLLPTREFQLDLPATVDLAAASAVNFVWRPRGTTDRNLIAATTTDAASAIVTVELDAEAVEAVGLFEYQFEITIAGKVLVVPDEDFYVYAVTETI